MPTYEYECSNCDYTFEEFQKITDRPLAQCPKCGGRLRRLISGGAGLIFRGSGFYVTDYKKSNLPQKSEDKGKVLQKSADKPKTPATTEKSKES